MMSLLTNISSLEYSSFLHICLLVPDVGSWDRSHFLLVESLGLIGFHHITALCQRLKKGLLAQNHLPFYLASVCNVQFSYFFMYRRKLDFPLNLASFVTTIEKYCLYIPAFVINFPNITSISNSPC